MMEVQTLVGISSSRSASASGMGGNSSASIPFILAREATGGNQQGVGFGVQFQRDDAFRQLADEVGEQPRGDGDGALGLDAGAGPDGNRHLLIHGRQLQPAVFRCQEDIAEQRGAGCGRRRPG